MGIKLILITGSANGLGAAVVKNPLISASITLLQMAKSKLIQCRSFLIDTFYHSTDQIFYLQQLSLC